MKKLIKRIFAAAVCAALTSVMAVTAAADVELDMKQCYVEGDADGVYDRTATEITAEGKVDFEETFITATYQFTGELKKNVELWNSSGATVSAEVLLQTEGVSVFACMPGFAKGWKWIDPSDKPELKYNEWVTVSEPLDHFYPAYSADGVDRVLLQIRALRSGLSYDSVKVTFRNLKINGISVEDAVVTTTTTVATTTTTVATTTTTEATTTTPEPIESEPVEEPVESDTTEVGETAEGSESTESEPEATTTVATTTATTVEATTTPATEQTEEYATAPSTTINYGQYQVSADTGDATMAIVVIIIIAVVVVAGAVIGYVIYRKMKFY